MSGVVYKVNSKTRPKCFDPEINCTEKTLEGYCLVGGPEQCGAYHQAKIIKKADLFCS